ncbi:MAG: M13 family metallopeptidase [Rubrivivax sp.]
MATACDDFDNHVNGTWTTTADLPPDRVRIGSFDTLRRANDQLLQNALTELDAGEPPSSPGLRLLAAYRRSGMDEAAIEARGLTAVSPLLARIDAVDREGLPRLMGELAQVEVDAPLSINVGIDARDATRHVLSISQAGLGLPDRDDYFRSDADSRRVREAYRRHAATLLQAAGATADTAAVDALLAFETRLAQASMTRVQRRDPLATYHPMTVAQLQQQAPGFDWSLWLAAFGADADLVAAKAATSGAVGAGASDSGAERPPLVVAQPAFAAAVAQLVQDTPLIVWRDYLRVRLLDATAPHLPKRLAQSHFDYHRGAIRGQKTPPPRDEQVIEAIGGRYGGAPLAEALGELFVSKAFSPQAQARALQMLDDIKVAMHARIDALPWMAAPTKRLAQAKLDAMTAKIGAPQRFKTYAGLTLEPDDYAGNLLRVNAWNNQRRLRELAQPVDRTQWNTSAHIVNAFAASGNQIVFPAGILQPPFFDAQADDASNYGAIGMVIGHEITHHFDDRGRQFDAVGNLRDWWSAADVTAYKTRADQVAALYDGYEPVPGTRIDGRLTLGENISDLGGLQIAYDGLQIALARERKRLGGGPLPLLDEQTPEQRFFTANAIVWRSKTRNEALVDQLRTDGHSPGRWRVLAPMSQSRAFAQAFGCKAGDAMVAPQPIEVW